MRGCWLAGGGHAAGAQVRGGRAARRRQRDRRDGARRRPLRHAPARAASWRARASAEPLVPDRVVVGERGARPAGAGTSYCMNVRLSPRDAARLGGAGRRAGGGRRRARSGSPYAELLDRSLRLARGAPGAGRGPRRPRGDLHGQLGRLRDGDLRDAARRRRLRRRQPADEGGQAPLRPRRLRGSGGSHRGEPHANALWRPPLPPSSVKAVVADSAPEGVEGALSFEDVVAASAPEPRHAGNDPARPRRPHLHVGEHGLSQGRDDDPPEHGLRRREHRAVPAAGRQTSGSSACSRSPSTTGSTSCS